MRGQADSRMESVCNQPLWTSLAASCVQSTAAAHPVSRAEGRRRVPGMSVAQYQPAHSPRGDYLAMDEFLVIALDRSRHVQVIDHQAQRLAQPLLGYVRQPVDSLQLRSIIEVKPGDRILRRLAVIARLQQVGG